MVVVTEHELNLTFLDELQQESCGEANAVAHVVVVDAQQMVILVTHSECACRTCGEYRMTLLYGFAHRGHVHLALSLGLLGHAVGD